MACPECAKRAAVAARNRNMEARTAALPQGAVANAVQLKFTGKHKASVVYSGKSGRRYLAGDNATNRIINAHPDDVQTLLRTNVFEMNETQALAENAPEPTQNGTENSAAFESMATGDEETADPSEKWIAFLDSAGQNLQRLLNDGGIRSAAEMERNLLNLENIKGIGKATAEKIRKRWSAL